VKQREESKTDELKTGVGIRVCACDGCMLYQCLAKLMTVIVNAGEDSFGQHQQQHYCSSRCCCCNAGDASVLLLLLQQQQRLLLAQ